jgi:uncharacterized LabA/DUF88 family protein
LYVPHEKRAVAFFDGQNLFYAAKYAFGYSFPNYDVGALAEKVATANGWRLAETRFYTGIPDAGADPIRHAFWAAKTASMGRQGIFAFTRPLRSRTIQTPNPVGPARTGVAWVEKGIDVRIAIDVISLAFKRVFDVAIVFSQDQDLSEVANEIRAIAAAQGRWIKIVSAYPVGTDYTNTRGINGTDWFKMDKPFYDSCIDPTDYRPRRTP